MIIIFLIITAVFEQLAAVKINMGNNKSSADKVIQKDLQEVKVEMKVTLFKNKMELFDRGQITQILKEAEEYDFSKVEGFFSEARNKYPEKKDIIIFADDDVPYLDVIGTMDHSLQFDFSDIIVSGLK